MHISCFYCRWIDIYQYVHTIFAVCTQFTCNYSCKNLDRVFYACLILMGSKYYNAGIKKTLTFLDEVEVTVLERGYSVNHLSTFVPVAG